jgi:hypothetical protein
MRIWSAAAAQVDEALDPFVYDGFVDEVIVVEDRHEPLREMTAVDQRHDRGLSGEPTTTGSGAHPPAGWRARSRP